MSLRALTPCLFLSLFTIGCGPAELSPPEDAQEQNVQAAAACVTYLLDLPNFSGPLNPFPVASPPGTCFNLPSTSDNRTSSFRLANCISVRFFDGANCTGTSYTVSASGVMPAWFDNRTTSLVLN